MRGGNWGNRANRVALAVREDTRNHIGQRGMSQDIGAIPLKVKPILIDVLAATCEELMEAGWGSVERNLIPSDWRTRRPNAKSDKAKA